MIALMAERRAFWTAFTVAMFSLGLGAYLSLEVALKVSGKPYDYTSRIALVSLGCALVGFAAGGLLLRAFARVRAQKLKVNEFTARGNELRRSLDVTTAAMREGILSWAEEVSAWLGENLPELQAHFSNKAEIRTDNELVWEALHGGSGDQESDLLRSYLKRLAEITLKL